MTSRGFTLIETVMVIVLLGIVAAGILMYFTGMRGSADPVLRLQAIELAQERMERIIADKKAIGFNSIAIGITTESPVTGFANFTRTTEVCYIAENSATELNPNNPDKATECATVTAWKWVNITVSWTGGGSLSLVTVLSDH